MKKTSIHFLSLFVSLAIFIIVYESISYIKYNSSIEIENTSFKKSEVKEDISTSSKKEVDFDEHKLYVECMEKDIMADCDNIQVAKRDIPVAKLNPSIEQESITEYVPFFDLMRSNLLILIIYGLLVYTLAKQTCLYLLSKYESALTEIDFHRAEWNINTAPMFGLLGTFFSIAILLNNAGGEDISVKLLENFFDAVMTTIIGIIFYIINFKLKISIYPLVKFND
ncbi:MAG TPA: hypothetical protein ENK66_08985 [Arcobacter sp.]|nr:hypothetical protein [Arcobacter sp.]